MISIITRSRGRAARDVRGAARDSERPRCGHPRARAAPGPGGCGVQTARPPPRTTWSAAGPAASRPRRAAAREVGGQLGGEDGEIVRPGRVGGRRRERRHELDGSARPTGSAALRPRGRARRTRPSGRPTHAPSSAAPRRAASSRFRLRRAPRPRHRTRRTRPPTSPRAPRSSRPRPSSAGGAGDAAGTPATATTGVSAAAARRLARLSRGRHPSSRRRRSASVR